MHKPFLMYPSFVLPLCIKKYFAIVADRPEIDQEETFIHTREGDQTEVLCVVHSSPRAEVTWYKNGEPLDTNQHQINTIGNRHTLSLPITTKEAFGQYTCRAQNEYGESQKTTEVSGKKTVVNCLFQLKLNIVFTFS